MADPFNPSILWALGASCHVSTVLLFTGWFWAQELVVGSSWTPGAQSAVTIQGCLWGPWEENGHGLLSSSMC